MMFSMGSECVFLCGRIGGRCKARQVLFAKIRWFISDLTVSMFHEAIHPNVRVNVAVLRSIVNAWVFDHVYAASSHLFFHPISRIYAGALPFSCASIFRLAARIISSLLLCRFICLSFLSALHAFFGCSSAAGSEDSFEDKLYLVIRSS